MTLPSAPLSKNSEHNPDGLFDFRFQVGSCANQNPLDGTGHRATTYEHLNEDWADKVHFHIMNGDWLYEEQRVCSSEAWRLVHGLNEYPVVVNVMPTIVGVWENYILYLSRGVELAKWQRHVPSYFTFDDRELVNDIWGTAEAGKRHRRTVFRDIGTQTWFDYLGWANPMEHQHPIHFGKASMKAGSDLLDDKTADFTKLPLREMLNLHVHWGTPEAGVNEMLYDNDEGNQNSYVYDILEVVDQHTLRLHMPANASALEFLRADYTFVNRDLTKLYGAADQVPVDEAAKFHRVQFTNKDRGGLLGQASVLTVSANGIETSPVIRGIWLMETILETLEKLQHQVQEFGPACDLPLRMSFTVFARSHDSRSAGNSSQPDSAS